MDALKIRKDFHHLIDNISDTQLLQEFYTIISDYSQRNDNIDILDELSDEQQLILNESLEQYHNGETLGHKQVKANIKKWLEE